MSAAEIYDRGYRDFEGQRTGVSGAIRSVAVHSARSVLGLGRPGRYKILPIILIAISYIPALVFVGLSILLPDEISSDLSPSYSDSINYVITQVILFAAVIIPGVLVKDRRDGMLALYLSSPLQRSSYILAKAIAVIGVLMFVTVGPALLQFLGNTFAGVGPDGFGNWLLTLLRVAIAGTVVAAFLGTIGLAASSLTDRPVFASVGIVVLFFLTGFIGNGPYSNGQSANFLLISLGDLIANIVRIVFGEELDAPDLSKPLAVLGFIAWFAFSAGAVWWRYRRIEATR